MNFKRNAIWYIIIVSTIIRCLLAANLELGNDEVYYWTYALHLQSSYFDHPPLVAFFIRMFTFNLSFNQEFFVRLTAIIGSAINTWLIYRLLAQIKNERAGLCAALLYTSCTYTSIISGLFILPDSPQVVFWLLSIYLLVQIFIRENKPQLHMLLLGAAIGVCTLCKIHGLYLWFAAGMYILLFDRKWLLNKYLWFAIIITCIFLSPILIWNVQNDFITYTYHSQRVVADNGIHLSSFVQEISGEILYTNPINFVLIVIALVVVVRRKLYATNKKLFWLLLLLSLPLIATFWSISLFRDTLPHWPGPGYIALLIFVAYYANEIFTRETKLKYVLLSANSLLFVIMLAGYFSINYLPDELGSTANTNKGEGDFTLDMYGWKNFATQFSQLHQEDITDGAMNKTAVMLSNKWFPAAHLDYYVAHPINMKLYAFGPLFDIHNMAWLDAQNGNLKPGVDAYYVAPSNYNSNPETLFAHNFKQIEKPVILPEYRGGIEVRQFYVYRMKDYLGGLNEEMKK